MMIAICFLTVAPTNRQFIDFCESLKNDTYVVYLCVDNELHKFDTSCEIIQIPSRVAETAGYKSSVLYFNNKACARDKALYYFCLVKQYQLVWFIEEDVFVPQRETIAAIDTKYGFCDLLSPSNYIFLEKPTFLHKNTWHWKHILQQTSLPPPFAASLVCAIRVSWRLLRVIRLYAQRYNNLFLDEVLFNTLALKANLHIVVANELRNTILYRHPWETLPHHLMPPNCLYHPVKDLDTQTRMRKKYEANNPSLSK